MIDPKWILRYIKHHESAMDLWIDEDATEDDAYVDGSFSPRAMADYLNTKERRFQERMARTGNSIFGIPVEIDERVPEDEVWLRDGKIIVCKTIGLRPEDHVDKKLKGGKKEQ